MATAFETAPTRTANVNGNAFVYRNHRTGALGDWDSRIIDGLA